MVLWSKVTYIQITHFTKEAKYLFGQWTGGSAQDIGTVLRCAIFKSKDKPKQ